MLRFLFGLAVGAAGALLVRRARTEEEMERRFVEMQDRANSVLGESRRILQETRQELTVAMRAGRRSLEGKAERIRRAAQEERERPVGPTEAGGDQGQGPLSPS